MKKLALLMCLMLAACGDDENNNNAANNTSTNNTSTNNTSTNNTSTNNTSTNNTSTNTNNTNNSTDNNVVSVNNQNNTPTLEIACFEELLDAWPLNIGVNKAELNITTTAGVSSGTIDAAAGGSMAAAGSSFVYLDLDTGARLDIDDFQAYSNTEWDLAFKRVVIRTNSASSGPGQVELGKIAQTTFEDADLSEVTVWTQDNTMDATCIGDFDPVGNPVSAFNLLNLENPTGSESWYAYGDMGVAAQPDVYFVKNSTKTKTYKFEIQSWNSGVYTVRWAEVSE